MIGTAGIHSSHCDDLCPDSKTTSSIIMVVCAADIGALTFRWGQCVCVCVCVCGVDQMTSQDVSLFPLVLECQFLWENFHCRVYWVHIQSVSDQRRSLVM